jgi:hypothetical protein
MVTVVPIDDAGQAISTASKTALEQLYNGNGSTIPPMREVNFEVHVIDPEHTTIDVTFTAVAWGGYDPEAVEDAAVEAIQSYLDPAMWGQPLFGDERLWVNETTIRLGELYTVLNEVDGLRHVTALTFRKAGGVLGTGDVVMDGPAPLPTSGTISAAVS